MFVAINSAYNTYMKNLILITAFAGLTCNAAKAQTEKRSLMLGAGLASIGSYVNPYSSGSSYFNIYPTVGYFVKDNLALGATLSVGFAVNHGGGTSVQFGLSPYIRPYFSKTESRAKMFGEAALGFYGYTVSGSNFSVDDYVATATVGAGFSYFLTRNVSLESILRVSGTTLVDDVEFHYQPSVNFGFQIYLNPKTDKWKAETAEILE